MNNNIYTFWSPSCGSGTSLVALNFAMQIVKKGNKVALIDFNLRTPSLHHYIQSEDSLHNLDNVLPFIPSKLLSAAILEENMQLFQGVSVLRGTSHTEQASRFDVSEFEAILKVASESFDYVILDVYSVIDNAATYVALNNSDKVFLICEPNAIRAQQFEKDRNYISSEIKSDRFGVIINKSHDDIYMDSLELSDYFGYALEGSLPFLDFDFLNAINKGNWIDYLENNKKAKKYSIALQSIVDKYATEGLNVQNTKKQFSFFKR